MAQWCVLVYMSIGADVTDALDDLDEAQEAAVDWNTDDIQAWFLLNTAARGVVATPRAAGLARTEVGPTSLADFVASKQDVWNECPKRALVLWGHGNPRPRSWGTSEVGVAPSPTEVVAVFNESDLLPPTVVGYDACGMGTIDVGYELATMPGNDDSPLTAWVSSQIPEPASGWPYDELFNGLENVVNDPTSSFARLAVTRYAASVASSSFSIGAFDPRGFPSVPETVTSPAIVGLTDAVAALVADLTANCPRLEDILAAASRASLPDDAYHVDLKAFLTALNARHNLGPVLQPVLDALDRMTIRRRVSFRPGQAQIWGLSVPLPDSRRPQAATLFGPIPAAGGDRSTFSLDSGWAMFWQTCVAARRRRRS